MFRFLSITLLCLGLSTGLSACALSPPPNIAAAPYEFADGTVLDEQAALGVELAYQASALTLKAALRSGVIKGDKLALAAKADNSAYAAVKAVRSAYAAGNARSYTAALIEARRAVTQTLALVKGDSS